MRFFKQFILPSFLATGMFYPRFIASEIKPQTVWDEIPTEAWLKMDANQLLDQPFVKEQNCELRAKFPDEWLECPPSHSRYEGLPTKLRFYFMPDDNGVSDYVASVQIGLDPNLKHNDPDSICSWLLHDQKSKWGDYQDQYSSETEEILFIWKHEWGKGLIFCNPPHNPPQISLEYSLPIWPHR